MIAILFHRIGPYHKARLCAAAKVLKIVAIQGSEQDDTYAWEKVTVDGEFPVRTLFRDKDAVDHSGEETARQLSMVLDEARPEAVVIPGWSSRLALAGLLWGLRARRPVVVMSESTEWDEDRA